MNKNHQSRKCRLKTGLILTGGGSRAAFEVGVIKVLMDEFTPDFIIGTSAGAINAAYIATGTRPSSLEMYWKKIDRKFAFPVDMRSCLHPNKSEGLCNLNHVKTLLQKTLRKKKFEQCRMPLYINAADFLTGKSRYFHKGKIIDAVIASSAFPIIFSPCEVDGRRYMDGGMGSVLCLDKAMQLGAKQLIIVNVTHKGGRKEVRGLLELLSHSFEMVLHNKIKTELDLFKLKNKQCKLVVIEAKSDIHMQNFNTTKELIRKGESAARRVLKKIII